MSIFGGRQPGQPRYSGQLHNLQLTESVFGTTLPIVIGTQRVHGKLLDYNGFTVTQVSGGGGKGIFGGKGQIATYSANVVIALAQGPCAALLNIWDQQGKLANQTSTVSYTVPSGGGTYVKPYSAGGSITFNQGVTVQQSYSITANDYGSGGPVTYSGTQTVALDQVSGAPGAGQYNFNAGTGVYTFGAAMAGITVAITFSAQFSLYYFQQTQAAEIPLSYPYTISTDNQSYFQQDNGVTFVDTGAALTSVGGTPTASGTYNENVGFYTFAPADAGRYVYINYTYYSSDSTLTSSSALNLVLFTGEQGQSPWGFLVANDPSSAFGYTGVCYIGSAPMSFGESPTLPSYNYEVAGQCMASGWPDADVTQAITLLLTDPLCGVNFPSGALGNWSLAQAYWGANNFFISDVLTTQSGVSDKIKQWLEAGNVGAVWSQGVLKLIPYGDRTAVGNGYTYTPPTQPAFTLTMDDILPSSNGRTGQKISEDPIQVDRINARDAYNYVQCEWTNRENDYNNELTQEQNDAFIRAYGLRMEGSQSWHFITTQAAASWALNLRLKRNLYKRNTYKFNLPFTFSAIEPMDVLVLPSGIVVRVTEVQDDEDGKLGMTAEPFAYGSSFATIYPKQPPSSYQPNNSQAIPGNTSAWIFEATPQTVLAQPNTIQIAVAGNQPAWGGCDVYVSTDNTTYTKIARVLGGHTTGLLSAALPIGSDPDTTDTLSVDMTLSNGELVSATSAEANSYVTLCAIVDQSGSMELVSYETATLTGTNRYNLTYLRRGVYGTEILGHSIGAEFAYIGTSGVFEYQYPAQYVGQTLYFKFPAFNLLQGQIQSLSQCLASVYTIGGNTLQPPSSGPFYTVPANVLSARTGSSSTGSSQINYVPFYANLNGQSVYCNPPGGSGGLNANQTYECYYIDPAFRGGGITMYVTQNPADYLGKSGYYYVGSVTTPAVSGTPTYYPRSGTDIGTSATQSPQNAWSKNPNLAALVEASTDSSGNIYTSIVLYNAFPNVLIASGTVYFTYQTDAYNGYSLGYYISQDGGNTFPSAQVGLVSTSKTTSTEPLTVSGTFNLSNLVVKLIIEFPGTSSPSTEFQAQVFDIHVQ